MSISEGIGDRFTVIAAGTVNGTTGALAGVGFTVTHPATGLFILLLDEAADAANIQIVISPRSATGQPLGWTIAEALDDRTKTISFFIFTTLPVAQNPGSFDIVISTVV